MVNLVRTEYLEKVPDWYKSNEEQDLVLSDDIDSLVTVSILKSVKSNWHVNYFYDFNTLFINEGIIDCKNKIQRRIWCDVACLRQEKCFDNHISRKYTTDIKNNLCINPNLIADVSAYHYTDKYAGSTALLVWSLYNIPLPKTEEGKMLLLAIDSTFKGFYDSRFTDRNRFFLCDVLGLEELYEVEQRHTISEFYQIISKYGLSAKIRCVDGKLETKLDLETIGELLDVKLILDVENNYIGYVAFEERTANMCGVGSVKDLSKGLVTLAFTFRNNAKYSIVKKKLVA